MRDITWSMPDLDALLAANRSAVDDLTRAARALPVERWYQPRAAGKWSPAQLLEHVAIAYEKSQDVIRMERAPTRIPRFLRSITGRLFFRPILRKGMFPERSPGPKLLRPSAHPPDREAVLRRLRVAAEVFEGAANERRQTGRTMLDHPFFGAVSLEDWVRFSELHTRHHVDQVV